MSETRNDGGPVFPCGDHSLHEAQAGITLRDWIATHAMPVTASCVVANLRRDMHYGDVTFFDPNVAGMVAEQAYILADAMLKARDSTP